MYKIVSVSRKLDKQFGKVMSQFSDEQVDAIETGLKTEPKGTAATHWKIKKVGKAVWQYDLPEGYRIIYTLVDEMKVVLILFIGNHDDAAVYLRGKQ